MGIELTSFILSFGMYCQLKYLFSIIIRSTEVFGVNCQIYSVPLLVIFAYMYLLHLSVTSLLSFL